MQNSPTYFLEGGGTLRRLIEAHDWSGSPLGQPSAWPQCLKTLAGFALDSKFPMFLTWGAELTFIYNDAYSEILGTRHPSALGKTFQEIWPDIWNEIFPFVERALSGEAVFLENLPLTMYRKGYEESAWFTFTYSPLRDETGSIRGMICTCVETTSQVLAERQKTAEIERLRDLFQQTPGFMALMSGPEHVYELTNPAYLQLLGHRDVIGNDVRKALPELEGQGYFEILDKVYETGKPFIGQALPVKLQRLPDDPLDERILDFIFQPVTDTTGKVTAIFIQGNDVTDAVKARQALSESEERLRQLANTIPHLTWMANPDGTIHWYNDRWYEFTGLSKDHIGSWEWEDIIDPPYLQKIMERWVTSVGTGLPYEFTGPVRSTHGEYRTFYMRADPLRDSNGNIVQWFGINTDVTEIHKAQAELMAANRRKDDFLAMLAHELRNPLAPIGSAAELLQMGKLDQARVQKTSEIIGRQVRHMTHLIDDLLDVSRVTRGLVELEKSPIEVRHAVIEAVEQVNPLIHSRHHQLALHLVPDATMVLGDKKRLVQVFANLLNNAAKYTPEGGQLELRTMVQHGHIVIEVTDSGIGMTPELLAHAFDLFAQAERTSDRSLGGLGLGLALVKSLVELHGGTVTCTSEGLGKGSRFTVSLPIVGESEVEDPQQSGGHVQSDLGKSLRIMVVDDNVDAATMLAMLLETAGHEVLIEHGSCRALERAKREAPQVFLLDIGLPELDGYELAQRLRSQDETAAAILIAVTGYGQEGDQLRAVAAGFDHHLIKPVDTSKLAAILAQINKTLPVFN